MAPCKRKRFQELGDRQKRKRTEFIESDSGCSDVIASSKADTNECPLGISGLPSPVILPPLSLCIPLQESKTVPASMGSPVFCELDLTSELTENNASSSESDSAMSVPQVIIPEDLSKNNIITCQSSCNQKLAEGLSNWARKEKNLSNDSLTRLLGILRQDFQLLPSTGKALRRIQKRPTIIHWESFGDYAHFDDWMDSCVNVTNQCLPSGKKQITLSINIDGIPIYVNSKMYSAYPILVKILECPKKIICAGIYCTSTPDKKLPHPNVFLKKFIEDLKALENGIDSVHGRVPVVLGPFICDAPMRSYLKQVVCHSAYNSCERCIQKGEYHGGHVALLKVDQPQRTERSFTERDDPNHHSSSPSSPLETSLNLNMVSAFVLDYMHSACIGTMKRLLMRWKQSKKNDKKCHLSSAKKEEVECLLKILAKHVPSDFPRKLEGGFKYISYWKASEMRLMMIYVGFVLLAHKDIFPRNVQYNYLLFACSMRILLSDGMEENLAVVSDLMKDFVKHSIELYGKSFISYNIHCMTHLAEDYKSYGNLNNISAFPFESYLGSNIKGAVRSGYKPLHQICDHVANKNREITIQEKQFKVKTFLKNDAGTSYYKKICFGDVSICAGKIGDANNVIQLRDKSIAIISAIGADANTNIIMLLQCFQKCDPLFCSPLNSTTVGLYKVSKLKAIEQRPFTEYYCKMMLMPLKDKYVAIQIIHTLQKTVQ